MQNKAHPRLRFPGYKQPLIKKRLSQLSTINPKSAPLPDSFVYIDLESVQSGKLLFENRIPMTGAPSRAQRVLRNNDILFQTVRPYQRNNLYFDKHSADYVASTGYAQIRPDIEPAYLFQYLSTNRFNSKVLDRCIGSSYPAINSSDLGEIECTITGNHAEQRKIAGFLAVADDKISTLESKISYMRRYKSVVVKALFARKIRFSEKEGDTFPDWKQIKLNEATEPINRRVKKSVKIEVLTISAGSGFVTQKERFSQIIAGDSLERYTLLKRGEFSYNRGASKLYRYGCFFQMKDYEEALVPNIYRSFSFSHGFVPDFYSQLFSTGYADAQLRRFISSSARMDGLLNINAKDFYSLLIPAPCENEQSRIAGFLANIDNKIEAEERKLKQARNFKDSLLQQMFV